MAGVGQKTQDRLGDIARQRGMRVDLLTLRYCMERFLARLAASPYRDRFALKGAMLMAVWHGNLLRATNDIDLHGLDGSDLGRMREIVTEVCATSVGGDDGVLFEAGLARWTVLGGVEAHGERVSIPTSLGRARLVLQVDIGFGHAVTPGLERGWYPSLLPGFDPIPVACYPRETAVAEKLAVAVEFGRDSTRLRDYFDLRELSRRHCFSAHGLAEAIMATFARRDAGAFLASGDDYWRGALRPEFATPARCRAWRTWLGNQLPSSGLAFPDVLAEVTGFALPLLLAVRDGGKLPGYWEPSWGWSRRMASRDPAGVPVRTGRPDGQKAPSGWAGRRGRGRLASGDREAATGTCPAADRLVGIGNELTKVTDSAIEP